MKSAAKNSKTNISNIQTITLVLVVASMFLGLFNTYKILTIDSMVQSQNEETMRNLFKGGLSNSTFDPVIDAKESKVYYPELKVSVDLNQITREVAYMPSTSGDDASSNGTDSLIFYPNSASGYPEYQALNFEDENLEITCPNFRVALTPKSTSETEGQEVKKVAEVTIRNVAYEISSNYDACAKYVVASDYELFIDSLKKIQSY